MYGSVYNPHRQVHTEVSRGLDSADVGWSFVAGVDYSRVLLRQDSSVRSRTCSIVERRTSGQVTSTAAHGFAEDEWVDLVETNV